MIKTDDLYDTYGYDYYTDPMLDIPFYNHIDTCPCPECVPDEEEVSVRTLTLNFTEENSEQTSNTSITLEDDKTEYLPTVMAAVEKMLHAMGFDYVRLVKASESGHSLYTYN
jgi:hypothetical protein